MASEQPSAATGGSTAWLVKSLQSQTEWLALSLQGVFERGTPQRAVYTESSVEKALSKKRARRLGVICYLMSVSIFAFALGSYYAFVWRPCPKNFFYRSLNRCKDGCYNKEFLWNKTSWHETAEHFLCGSKSLNCTDPGTQAEKFTNRTSSKSKRRIS